MPEVINWACQGVLLAATASVCARMWRSAPAAVRYRLWWGTLAALLLTPAAALWTSSVPAAIDTPAGLAPIVELPPPGFLAAQIVGALWGAAGVLSLVRIGAAALAVRRIKRASVPFPRSREHQLKHWNAVRGAGRTARLALSPAVGSAAVLGGLPPVIAVSPSVLRQLDDEELDQIVLHEWAHVQRRDDVAQLLQQVIRALFVLHPAVWWSTRQLQLERELACDERVAQMTGSPKRYAQCLARLATVVRVQRTATMIPAALTRSQLSTRIGRLVQQPTPPAREWSMGGAAPGAVLLVAALVAAVNIPLVGELGPQMENVITSARMGDSTRSLRDQPRDSPVLVPARLKTPPGAGSGRKRAVTRSESGAVQVDRMPVSRAPGIQDLFGSIVNQPAGVPGAGARSSIAGVPAGARLMTLPGTAVSIDAPSVRAAVNEPASSAAPWSAATGAGIAIGRGSNKAARATAAFFTRMGKSFGGGF